MKKYPTRPILLPESELGPEMIYHAPTDEACANFVDYLEPEELEIWNKMSTAHQGYVTGSTNPFIVFKSIVKGDYDYVVKENQ